MKRLILVPMLVFLACNLISMPCFGDDAPLEPEEIPRLEPTQWAIYGELDKQKSDWQTIVKNEGEMVKKQQEQIANGLLIIAEMNKNSEIYTKEPVGTALQSITQLIESYNESQGVLRTLSNIDQNFYNKFFSVSNDAKRKNSWVKNYSEQYYNLSVAMDDRFKKSLKSVKITADNINNSKEVMEKLIKASKNPKGRNQILQIRNELLTFMMGETVEVQTLMMQQFDDYVNFFQRQRSDEIAFSKVMDADMEKWEPSYYAGRSYTGSLHRDKR